MEAGTLDRRQACRDLIEAWPFDAEALHTLILRAYGEGDLGSAKEYAWRAVRAHPWSRDFLNFLSALVREEEPYLADGLAALGFAKLDLAVRAGEAQGEIESSALGQAVPEGLRDLLNLEDPAVFGTLATAFEERRAGEPEHVSELLEPFRLMHELQAGEPDEIERPLIERILARRKECFPLLVGIVRGWCDDSEYPRVTENLLWKPLALLGESGDPALLEALLDFADIDDAAGVAAHWALVQIARKYPAEAAAAIRGHTVQGLAMTDVLYQLPPFEGRIEAYTAQLRDFPKRPKRGREVLLLQVVSGLVRYDEPAAISKARQLAKTYRSLIGRETRDVCEEILDGETHLRPPLSRAGVFEMDIFTLCEPETMEQIFSGFEDDVKAEEEEEGHDSVASAARAPREPLNAFYRELKHRLAVYMTTLPHGWLAPAKVRFFETAGKIEAEESELSAFIEYATHDFVLPAGRTVLEEYVAREGGKLPARERLIYEDWARARVSIYEVRTVHPGEGVELDDLLRGVRVMVHDINSSRSLVQWDGLVARVERTEGKDLFSGNGTLVPRKMLADLVDWVKSQRRILDEDWAEFLRKDGFRIPKKVFEMGEAQMRGLKLVNTEGHELVFSKAFYDVLDEEKLRSLLDSVVQFEQSEEGYSWLNRKSREETGSTVLGNLLWEPRRLTLDCNSRERLVRGRELIEKLARNLVRHQRDEFKSVEEAMREKPRDAGPAREVPPEVARQVIAPLMEKHWAEWPDVPLPALNGRTPRQAAQSAEGRQKLRDLFKEFENLSAREALEGRYVYDFSRLKAELGLTG